MSIQVIKQGIADSIQDNGRYGCQHLGINPNGVMDPVAAAAANLLVGNDLNEAVIEMHFPASVFLFKEQSMIAICGADLLAMINDVFVPVNTPIIIEKNCVLQFKKPLSGARAYLAVKGGFELQPWLGSFSTNTKAAAGGFEGRNLKKHDELNFRTVQKYGTALKNKDCEILNWKASVKNFYPASPVIRITRGSEFDWLTEDAKKRLQSDSFIISNQSDRMGYRMKGDALTIQNENQLISTGITKGTIQLLPDGQFIILMADHQTTGGYPKIAHVISADIPALAQMNAGEKIQFKLIEQQEAEDLLFEQQQQLLQLQNAISFPLLKFKQQYAID